MANGGIPGVDWQTGMVDTGVKPLDQTANALNSLNRSGFNLLRNTLGLGQAEDANAGKRDSQGFLIPAYGATTTTGRVVAQPDGSFRIPEKDLKTGKVSWRMPTAQEEARAGVNSKTGVEKVREAGVIKKTEDNANRQFGILKEQLTNQGRTIDLQGKQIDAGITAANNANTLAIQTLQANIEDNRENRKQRSQEFSAQMEYQTRAMEDANKLKAQQLLMDDQYRKDALAQTQKSNRLQAIMGLSSALAQARF